MWYSDLSIGEHNFRMLALQFGAIQLPIFSSKLSLKSGDGDYIAYADINKACIVINNAILDGTHHLYNGFQWSARLEVCNGIIIHEIGHFMYSSGNISDYKINNVLTPNIGTICNVVEDLYLENTLSKLHSFAAYFLHKACSIVINNEIVESCMLHTTGEKPTSLGEAEAYVQYIISYKRRDYLFTHRSEWEANIYEKLLSVLEIHDCSERIKVAHAVYKEIFGEFEKEDEKQNNQELSSIPNVLSIDVVESRDNGKNESIFFVPVFNADEKKTKIEVKRNDLTECYTILELKARKNSFTEVRKPRELSKKINLEKIDFSPLIGLENSRSSVRSVVGMPQNSGRRMTHLHRAMDDGKIYSTNYLDGMRAGKGSPEIVFLVDLSGSMADAYCSKEVRCSKLIFALSCIYEINKTLNQTRIKFSIIGHTTKVLHFNGVVITSFKEFKESVNNASMLNRIGSVYSSLAMDANADANALLYASTTFSKGSHDKIILVISDGKPVETFKDELHSYGIDVNYTNHVDQLKQVVKYIRSTGVKVFSASIDSVALAPCNIIYGEANNVMVNNPSNLMSIISKSLNN